VLCGGQERVRPAPSRQVSCIRRAYIALNLIGFFCSGTDLKGLSRWLLRGRELSYPETLKVATLTNATRP
jgi:hypothetical protein